MNETKSNVMRVSVMSISFILFTVSTLSVTSDDALKETCGDMVVWINGKDRGHKLYRIMFRCWVTIVT